MKPLLLGSHPALDFLNTGYGPPGARVEVIGNGQSFLEWLAAVGLVTAAEAASVRRGLGNEALDTAASQARLARQWIADWIGRWRDAPQRPYSTEIRRLNALLARARCHRTLVRSTEGLRLLEQCSLETADDLLAVIAAQVASLVAFERPELVKRCAGAQCTLWFLDRTRAHRRMFCSAAACGNRAKVAAFRERQRAS